MHNQLGVNKQTRRPVGVNQRAHSAAQLFVCTQASLLADPALSPSTFDYPLSLSPSLTADSMRLTAAQINNRLISKFI